MRKLSRDVVERDFARVPLTRREIETLLSAAGSVEAILNTRHEVARRRGWKVVAPSKEVFVAAALKENRLLRRPLLLARGKVAIGKDPAAIAKILR